MENRNFIIDRLKSKTVTIDEFNYDSLQAPPIAAMFSPMDIAQLNQIATSIKYSAKPQIKYQEIDKIMRRRGFVKFAAGTNRVVYRPVENNTFVVKVAYDSIGLGDNPREFRNQFIFKPFVTKCFEVTPCGTLGIFERVNPITSREEFLSVASDIFEVINNWFIGEYVLEDIGVRYFMNWAIRNSFGPVLLDYPYCYKLDGNKLFCNAPNPNSPSGCCEGVIDYDPGFNFLYCTKCGVKYKAKELEEAIKEKEIIVKSEGDVKMKVSIKGGSKQVNKSINVGEYADLAKSMPSRPINRKKEKETKDVYPTVKVSVNKKVNKVPEIKIEEEKVEVVTEPTPVPEVTVVADTSSSKLSTVKEIISPISFDDSLKDPVTRFNKLMEEALEIMRYTTEEENYEKMYKSLNDNLVEIFNIGLVDLDDEEVSDVAETSEMILNRAGNLISLVVDNVEDQKFDDFVKSFDEKVNKKILSSMINNKIFSIGLTQDISFSTWEEEESGEYIEKGKYILINCSPKFEFESGNITSERCSFSIAVLPGHIIEPLTECGYNVFQKSKEYNDCKFFPAKVINVKDIFPKAKISEKIIVILDKDGNYLTMDDGNIISIDMIDDKEFTSLSIVSSDWLNETLKRNEQNNYCYTKEEIEPVEPDNIPTGILPPVGVNGVIEEE